MKNRFGRFTIFVILLLVSWLVLSPVADAQTPTPPLTRESLIQEIQSRAQRDVNNGKPMETIEGLNLLFGEQATQIGMTPSEILKIYEDEYNTIKAMKPWWEGWLPNLGWVAAFIALLAAIFRGVIEEAGKKFVTKVGTAIYNRVARYRPFWMFALRKYRRSLEAMYSELRIPFRAGRPLQMQDVYVPVRVEGGSKQQVDAYQTIQGQKRLVVLGDPGSGKTMLLRHVAFTYARQGVYDFPDNPIPVYLELNRVESARGDLLTALTKALENHNFPKADRFLISKLENQSLLILLDGLDEVNAATRPDLVKQIQDLDQKYAGNRIIVTCRKAVYQGEMDGWVDQKLEIVEFSDQQIQRFMTSWQKDMPAEKSIEHFFRTLQERPQIMALARNPLLLTMVAYLYADTEFALPHSRSEFYIRSTDLLLDQWKLERNRYKATHKRIVLQRLALFNQNGAGRKTGERRTLELAEALKEIREVLPDLTLKTEDAQPLLDEIVQRSGLMLTLDGGTRYQFTHLTLQEYFAARVLEADQKGLLDFYRATPDAWREVVRLWCALEHDSTTMLKELYALDPVMAFECLSDAQQVDNAYADELIESFKPRLHEALTNDSLASAFALLAADPRPRGRKWFEFVKGNLDGKDNRLAACTVLARTNIPQAAEPLASLTEIIPEVRPYLIQLGNLAIPPLSRVIEKEVKFSSHIKSLNHSIQKKMGSMLKSVDNLLVKEWILDSLTEIGTPQAAKELQQLLWTDTPSAYHAAWRLAALLPLSGVEDILQTVALTSEQRNTKQIDWIWEPFSENANLRIIIGRIAYLLHMTPEDELPSKDLYCDPRLVLPLCAIAFNGNQVKELKKHEEKTFFQEIQGSFKRELLGQFKEIRESFRKDVLGQSTNEQDRKNAIVQLAKSIAETPVWSYLYSKLRITQQSLLLQILTQEKIRPSIEDWRNLFIPVSYNISTSWNIKVIKSLLLLTLLLNLWGIWLTTNQIGVWDIVAIGAMLLGIIILLSVTWTTEGLAVLCSYLCLGGGTISGLAAGLLTHNWLIGAEIGVLCGALSGALGGNVWYGYDMPLIKTPFPAISFGSFGKSLINIFVSAVGVAFFSGITSGILVFVFGGFSKSPLLALYNTVIYSLQNSTSNILTFVVSIVSIVGIIIVLLLVLLITLVSTLDFILMYFAIQLLYQTVGFSFTVIFWTVWLVCVYLLYFIGRHLERRSQNPLHGLLEPSGAAVSPRRAFSLLSRWFGFR